VLLENGDRVGVWSESSGGKVEVINGMEVLVAVARCSFEGDSPEGSPGVAVDRIPAERVPVGVGVGVPGINADADEGSLFELLPS
jgi:hypothetical protein